MNTKYAPRIISFRGYSGTELTQELNQLDCSNLETMSNMFYQSKLSGNFVFSNINAPLVKSLSGMFTYCSNLENIDLSNLKVPSATETDQMFYRCSNVKNINLSGADLSNVTNLCSFRECSVLESVDFSGVVFSNATNSSSSFDSCFNLKNIIGLNMPNLNNSGARMFYNCNSLEELIIPDVHFSGNNISNMFLGCSKLKKLDIRNFTFDKVSSSSYGGAFNDVPNDCQIIVKSDVEKEYITSKFSKLTNVVTVAELEESV